MNIIKLQDGLKCIYCRKKLDVKKDNYGWHINKATGGLERCYFANMPMKLTSRQFKLKNLHIKYTKFISLT
jgi:hypothetical protein